MNLNILDESNKKYFLRLSPDGKDIDLKICDENGYTALRLLHICDDGELHLNELDEDDVIIAKKCGISLTDKNQIKVCE